MAGASAEASASSAGTSSSSAPAAPTAAASASAAGAAGGAGAAARPASGLRASPHAQYGEHWGEGAARCFSLEQTDFLDEDHAVRLMPVPDNFLCPISSAIMVDPVATVDGCVYERVFIERWFRERRQAGHRITSPLTGLDLPSATLMPLMALQRAIEAYLAHRPELKREHMAGRSFEEAAQMLQTDLFEKQQVHATTQDKVKRLKLANKELVRALHGAEARILQLHGDRLQREATMAAGGGAGSAGGGAGGNTLSTPPVADGGETASTATCASTTGSAATRVEDSTMAAACGATGVTAKWGGPCVTVGVAFSLLLLLGAVFAQRLQSPVHSPPCHCQDLARPPILGPLQPRQPSLAIAFGGTMGAALAQGAAGGASSGGIGRGAPGPASRGQFDEVPADAPAVGGANPAFAGQLEHLRFGTPDEKQRAAFMLRIFASENAENQEAIAQAGAIGPLIDLLRDSSASLREEAARALWNLARNNKEINVKNQVAIGQAGAPAPLVQLLEDEVPRVRVVAAAVLNDLATDNVENQVAVARAGAVGPLVKLLKDEEAPALVMAASLLKSLAMRNGDRQDRQVATALMGAVRPLVSLLRAETLLAQEQAASALGALAAFSAEMQVAVARAGAIAPLVERLRADMMQGTAALALRHLAAGNPENQVEIVKAGAVDLLVKLLEDGMPGVREEAANALWNLAMTSLETQVAVVRAGAAIPLVALLKGDAQEQATISLLGLSVADGATA